MKELMQYRESLIDRFVHVVDEFCASCLMVKDVFTPLGEEQWNVHQIAAHVRDVHKLVYGSRARRTAVEDDPEFPPFNGEAYMDEQYSSSEPLYEILEELRGNVADLANMLRELPVEAWSRTSRHATLGHGFTLQSWVERDLAHVEEHMEVVNRNRQSFDKNSHV